MGLTEKQRKHVRRLAHPLRPLVMLGQAGLTDAVVQELERALEDHEIVKVSARLGERAVRDAAFEELARRTRSLMVQRVGHVGVFYRRSSGLAKVLLPDD
ncbi:MAG TPA: YhbY family RNA-binding protein [Steroidobacteraceae bacterium]|nr:YhbY family RNA-binding protein [Steroidobacteraceae bacterium]